MQIWNMTGKIKRIEIKYQLAIGQQQLKLISKSGIAKKELDVSFRVHLQEDVLSERHVLVFCLEGKKPESCAWLCISAQLLLLLFRNIYGMSYSCHGKCCGFAPLYPLQH